jgi:hypothetical protein
VAVPAYLAARRRSAGTQRGHRPDPGTGRREGGKLALRRAAALDDRRRIAGSGTHGKT